MIIKNKDIAPDISFWLIEKNMSQKVFIYSRGEKNKKKNF